MKTVERALDILEVVQDHQDGIGLADLSKITRLNIYTLRRLCSTLVERGYLYHKGKGHDYFLGLKLLIFNNVVNGVVSLREQAYPFLQRLCDEIDETIVMTAIDGIKPFHITYTNPKHILQAAMDQGGDFALHCTASGKIHLAFMKDEQIENIVNIPGLVAYTDNTITDKDQFRREIEIIRHDGVAFDDEEYRIGLRSAAAPIKSVNGDVIAAVGFIGFSVRVSSLKMRQFAGIVKRYALEISRSLGYKDE